MQSFSKPKRFKVNHYTRQVLMHGVFYLALSAALLGLSQSRPNLTRHINQSVSETFHAVAWVQHALKGGWYGVSETVNRHFMRMERFVYLERRVKSLEQEINHLRSRLYVEQSRATLVEEALIEGHSALVTSVWMVQDQPFSHMFWIAAGKEQGVRRNDAVVSQDGLAGRVITAYRDKALVMHLSDPKFYVPVEAIPSGEHFILGNKKDGRGLTLVESDGNAALPYGDVMLITSGRGGVFPRGIPVAQFVGEQADTRSIKALSAWPVPSELMVFRLNRGLETEEMPYE